MNIQKIQHIINNDMERKKKILKNKKYYNVENDILLNGVRPKADDEDPLRTADNRIPHNFHQLLVDEKASYLFTNPILFDIDNNSEINEKITEVLGNDFSRKSKDLSIETSNCGTSWLHYWIDESKDEKKYKYALVNTEEVIARYDNGLERDLQAIIRYYAVKEEVIDMLEDQTFWYIEYWTKDSMQRWKFKDSYTSGFIDYEELKHTLEEVPFIEFANNRNKKSDLDKYKKLIDLQDKVMSGFANDMEDIQQIIYILENYGGTDLNEFKEDLKRYKSVNSEEGGGLKTLQIEIPVEARKVILDILKEQIYESGQGLQQNMESVGNASGKIAMPLMLEIA